MQQRLYQHMVAHSGLTMLPQSALLQIQGTKQQPHLLYSLHTLLTQHIKAQYAS
jgi:hypothetical protein